MSMTTAHDIAAALIVGASAKRASSKQTNVSVHQSTLSIAKEAYNGLASGFAAFNASVKAADISKAASNFLAEQNHQSDITLAKDTMRATDRGGI